jgi:hypothetical protein
MIFDFDHEDGSKLIMYDSVWLKTRPHDMVKIKKAEAVVLKALDRQMPFAFNTVKKIHALQWVKTYQTRSWRESTNEYTDGNYIEWETDQIHEYKRITVYDRHTRQLMMRNYDKLITALRLLAKEGYVKRYVCRPSDPRLKITWYVDEPDKEPERVTVLDYILPPDFGTHPHVPKRYLRYREKKRQRVFEGVLTGMRKAFPLSPHGNGKKGGGNDHEQGFYHGYASPQSKANDNIQEGDIDPVKWLANQHSKEMFRQSYALSDLKTTRNPHLSEYQQDTTVPRFADFDTAWHDRYLSCLVSIMWFTMKGSHVNVVV